MESRRAVRVGLPPGRCARCAFPLEGGCLCPAIPRLQVPWRFLFLRHASEVPRLTNTGRWAAAALEGSVVVDHALGNQATDAALAGHLGDGPAALLYPTPHPPARGPTPRLIVVPDATWAQARRMVQRLEPLRALPRLALPAAPDVVRLRRPLQVGGRSTLEAVAGLLETLGEPAAASALHQLHQAAVEKTLRLKGMWPPGRDHHRREVC